MLLVNILSMIVAVFGVTKLIELFEAGYHSCTLYHRNFGCLDQFQSLKGQN